MYKPTSSQVLLKNTLSLFLIGDTYKPADRNPVHPRIDYLADVWGDAMANIMPIATMVDIFEHEELGDFSIRTFLQTCIAQGMIKRAAWTALEQAQSAGP